ncbi:hypothetical protein [Glutamicibacter sp.]|uniref:hypothetical protein n=1 Tax=Glutamicibacter sp. TaxID=1931995 RepID=UPI003D6A7383
MPVATLDPLPMPANAHAEVQRQEVVDHLVGELGFQTHLTPWGIFIGKPDFEETGRSTIKWGVT